MPNFSSRALPGSIKFSPLPHPNPISSSSNLSLADCENIWLECFESSFSCQCFLDSCQSRAASKPDFIDGNVWQMESLRSIIKCLNLLISFIGPSCTELTCPLMCATPDWEFLCAAHSNKPRKCCAIDYMIHTITNASMTLNDSELFPSRSSVPAKSISHFSSISRRLYRLFAHAYYHHQEIFVKWELSTGTTKKFLQLVSDFNLMDSKQCTPVIELSKIFAV